MAYGLRSTATRHSCFTNTLINTELITDPVTLGERSLLAEYPMVEEGTEECRGTYTSLRGCVHRQDEELEQLFNLQPDQVLAHTPGGSPQYAPVTAPVYCLTPLPKAYATCDAVKTHGL